MNEKKPEVSMVYRELLSFRSISILSIIFFILAMIINIAIPGSKIGETLGVLFHLTVMFIVSRLPAPLWAKAAGFGWLALDVTSGAMTLNNVPYNIAFSMRLGGHVMAAMWIITAASLLRAPSVRILGIITGLWLGMYTFFGSILPSTFLLPSAVLFVVWVGLMAYKYPTTPQKSDLREF